MVIAEAHIATWVFSGLIAAAVLYFVPTVIAFVRNHHRRRAIFLLNLFVGFTFIAWIGALWWACTDPHPPDHSHRAPPPAAG